jgi:hypothetical protein
MIGRKALDIGSQFEKQRCAMQRAMSESDQQLASACEYQFQPLANFRMLSAISGFWGGVAARISQADLSSRPNVYCMERLGCGSNKTIAPFRWRSQKGPLKARTVKCRTALTTLPLRS